MTFQIDSNVFWFLVSIILSALLIIGVMYIILILQRLFSILKRADEDIPTILDQVKSISISMKKLLEVIDGKKTDIGTTISSVATISDDVAHVSRTITNTVDEVKDVVDNTKHATQKIKQMANIFSKSANALQKEAKETETQNNQVKTYEIKDVKIEVNNE